MRLNILRNPRLCCSSDESLVFAFTLSTLRLHLSSLRLWRMIFITTVFFRFCLACFCWLAFPLSLKRQTFVKEENVQPCSQSINYRREQTCRSISQPRWKPFDFSRCDWLRRTTLDADWLYFSHVKKAVREADWTYRFFQMWNIANIKFYLQGLLLKILAIYIIKHIKSAPLEYQIILIKNNTLLRVTSLRKCMGTKEVVFYLQYYRM